MNTSSPRPEFTPSARAVTDEWQACAWLRLRHELAELHARLEYLKLMLTLGVLR